MCMDGKKNENVNWSQNWKTEAQNKKKLCERKIVIAFVLAFPRQIHSPLWLHVRALVRFFCTGRKTTHFFSAGGFLLLLLFLLSCQAMLANGICERHWRSNITFAVKICKWQNARCQARTAKKSSERSLETSALLRWYLLHATMQWQCLLEARKKTHIWDLTATPRRGHRLLVEIQFLVEMRNV